jgi:hypothetical protein
MALLIELDADADHWTGAYGPLLVVLWRTGFNPEICRKLLTLVPKVVKGQRGGKIAVASISLPTVNRPPNHEERAAIAGLLHDTDSPISRVAVVREVRGFVASGIVSIVAGLQQLARPQYGHRFFTSLSDAIPWATEELVEFRNLEIHVKDALVAIEQQQRRLLTPSLRDREFERRRLSNNATQ